MSDHSAKRFSDFPVDNEELFNSFGNISLNDSRQRSNHPNNGNGYFSSFASTSSVSDDSSNQVIPRENMSAQSSFINRGYEVTSEDYIVSLAMSRQGSQQLLPLVLERGQVGAKFLLKAVYGSLIEVMTNKYGCHVFNMIIDYCDNYLLATIICKIRPVLVDIACSEYGSFSIQKLITAVMDEPVLAIAVALALSFYPFQLMTCGKGRHVLELCFTLFHDSHLQDLYGAVLDSWFELAKDPQGCISLNRCIDKIPSPYRIRLLTAIIENSVCLSFDPSGTFVVQHVLGLGNPMMNNEICRKLKDNFIRLCYIQHGSHLVQKCIELSSFGILHFIHELCQRPHELENLSIDQFGNYIIQTALKVSQKKRPEMFKYLKNKLQKLERRIGKTIYGVHVFRVLNGLSRS